jgi:hypothetical protein
MKIPTLKNIFEEAFEEPPISKTGNRTQWQPFQIDTLFRDYASQLASMGVKIGIKLGTGTMGAAFDAGSGKVLKVTIDSKEANAAAILIGKKLNHVYNVYEVFQFDSTGYYGILQEKLKPVSDPLLKKYFDVNNNEWLDQVEYYVNGEISREEAIKRVRLDVSKSFGGPDKFKLNQIMDVVQQVFNGLDELDSSGILYYDAHIGNIMMRGSRYVIVDVGRSRSMNAPPIKEI